jgi:hypothetical protein
MTYNRENTRHSVLNTATEDNRRRIGPHTILPAGHPVSLILAAAGIWVE